MSAVQPHLGVDRPADAPDPAPSPNVPPTAAPEPAVPAPDRPAARHASSPVGDSGHGLRLAVSQQAELLALLAGSVRADLGPATGPMAELRPLDTVRLADLTTGENGDPLAAFGVVAPQFADDADRVVEDLGGRGQAA